MTRPRVVAILLRMEKVLNDDEIEMLGRVPHALYPQTLNMYDGMGQDVYLISPLGTNEVRFLFPDTSECILLSHTPRSRELWYKNTLSNWTSSDTKVFTFRAIWRGESKTISDKMEWLNP